MSGHASRHAHKRPRITRLALGLIVAVSSNGFAESNNPTVAAQITHVSPSGETRDVRQVVVSFDQDAIAFGDPRLPAPVEIACTEHAPRSDSTQSATQGTGRWVDARSWAFDFYADLPAGIRCTVKPNPGFTLADGVTNGVANTFSTGGPKIVASLPPAGASNIDENTIFALRLDGPVDQQTVEQHARCVVQGIGEQISVTVINDAADRDAVLSAIQNRRWRWRSLLGVAWDELGSATETAVADRLMLVKCARPLPPDTQLDLVWSQQIASPSGVTSQQTQRYGFKTRAAFTASLSCTRTNANSNCVPTLPLRVEFSAPVPAEMAHAVRLMAPDGSAISPVRDETTEDHSDADGTPTSAVTSISFAPPFAQQAEYTVVLPDGFVDDANRAPINASRFPLAVQTERAPPLAKFSGTYGILELEQGGVLPVTLRNLESEVPGLVLASVGSPTDDPSDMPGQRAVISTDRGIAHWLRRVEQAQRGQWQDGDYTPPGTRSVFDEAVSGGADGSVSAAPDPITVPLSNEGEAFEVVGIPLEQPGLHIVELASPVLGAALLDQPQPYYVSTAALVTNLAVHFKWGAAQSLVFVTELDSGEPVAGARVSISDGCGSGTTFASGTTNGDGLLRIDGGLPEPQTGGSCEYGQPPLLAVARHEGDLSFALTNQNNGIAPYDFNARFAYDIQPVSGHTVFDRTLLRAGQTVSMKHVLRQQQPNGFDVTGKGFETTLTIQHWGSNTKAEIPITFDANGIATSRWDIPETAYLGSYGLAIDHPQHDGSLQLGQFQVQAFQRPSMRAQLAPVTRNLVRAASVDFDAQVSYINGGGAGGLPVTLRTQLRPYTPYFAEYVGFQFGGQAVKTGVEAQPQHGAQSGRDGDTLGRAATAAANLDAQGSARLAADVPPSEYADGPQRLIAELDYPDANGQQLTTSSSATIWPASVALGLQTEGWAAQDTIELKVLALDLEGQPLRGQRVAVKTYQRITHSYRRRIIGGYYAYSHTNETVELDAQCSGRTGADGMVRCELEPDASGQVLIHATTTDAQGRKSFATISTYLVGDDAWWWNADNSDRIELAPEQREHNPGDTARIQVRSPFKHATALVTIEREGVIDAFVTELRGREPIIEVPIGDHYAPNVYVSVLAVRGRVAWWRSYWADFVRWTGLPFKVEGGRATALADLSRPAFKMGMTELKVGWDRYRLDVDVRTDQAEYQTRATARVDLQVTSARGSLNDNAEVAVAVVDAALLELAPNNSWQLLESMMQPRGLAVVTATGQQHVVGRRHYGRKTAAPGGGGGRAPNRQQRDSLLLWQARVPVDANGRASLDVPINDSLTEFKVVAIAIAGADQFGTGTTTFTTAQDLQLIPGLAPVVRHGDMQTVSVTVRNASARPLQGRVSAAQRSGDRQPVAQESVAQEPQRFALAPGQSSTVSWTAAVPDAAQELTWLFDSESDDDSAQDRLTITQRVEPAIPVRTIQATLQQVSAANPLSLDVQRPADAVPDRGGIQVGLVRSLSHGLADVERFMSAYPYICLEQQTSKAVALRDPAAWAAIRGRMGNSLDDDGLLRYYPTSNLRGSDILTSYVLNITNAAGFALPPDTQNQMLRGLERFARGNITRGSPLATDQLMTRRIAAIASLARYGRRPGNLLAQLDPDLNVLPTPAALDVLAIARTQPNTPGINTLALRARNVLRSRLNVQGTILSLSARQDQQSWWLMHNTDVALNRLLHEVLPREAWASEHARLLRGAIGRQQAGRWSTTVANAWGVIAVDAFTGQYESEAVTGTTTARLAGRTITRDWAASADADAQPGKEELSPADDRPPQDADTDVLRWPDEQGGSDVGAGTLSISHVGTGAPWATVSSRAAIPLTQPLSSGYRINRTIEPVTRANAAQWTPGDVLRVTLDITAQTDMTWVVVDDPIAPGGQILGSALGGQSTLLDAGTTSSVGARPMFVERDEAAYRAYFRYVPKGDFSVSYTVRLNTRGEFTVPGTRVEAMYAPEVFGTLPATTVTIGQPEQD